ncbi:transcription factor GTE4-like isoform X3 [Rhododendron vialii]|uniref:transcription factor GTE4-like isoform X3 n=1 Tax=Rhododendron vialii TaxID=182163 RepID=UPI00265D6AE0|nr:transcription factor GTE4-like isoform X3 [Rhododendron vialii]XP_058221554.1 transcription factor GTE4-like isoform X3 [Rhododendron vialii]XP_058221555.1 transcription factor GTE4-like isoform X3 [Rhododendron vialii]
MASGTLGELRERHKWGENNKVYTRKFRNKRLKNDNINGGDGNGAVTTANGRDSTTVAAAASYNDESNNNKNGNNDEKKNSDTAPQLSPQTVAIEDVNPSNRQQTVGQLDVVSDDLSSHGRPPHGNGATKPIISRVDNKVRISLEGERSKSEIRELKRKLVNELDQVRSLAKKLEDKEVQLTGCSTVGDYSHLQHVGNDERALVRVNSEVGSVGHHNSRPFQPLIVSMEVNNGVSDFVEKEKRTPKENPYYQKSDFLLGKGRLPHAENNKKLKSHSRKKHGGEMRHAYGMDKYAIQVMKTCYNLLSRLMKHKYAWVFNKPVDAKALGLHDYHVVIKQPMDLGTVKSRLSKNWYKSPREFAEDVRLTFRNAMTYNPKGQDVHIMAEELSKIFEEKWAAMESEYNTDWRYELVHDVDLPTPTSRYFQPPPPQLPVPEVRNWERAESVTGVSPADYNMKPNASVGRTLVPKKPKAKDLNKRDMAYEEKQRLSTNLQSLPSEKLDNIVQIIKKRNLAVTQHDDEIEVDIDNVDAETLWELDRFVSNYKKSLSKKKRRAELALQVRAEATPAVPAMNPSSAIMDAPKESKTADEKNAAAAAPPVQRERQGDNVSRSSSSSSSSSGSGSSSDSESDSSSGSDGRHSPST